MNSLLPDPDAKIYMSLDEIIQLDREQNVQLEGKTFKTMKRKKRIPRKGIEETGTTEHSVPLLSSAGGLDIYVTKQSPLLNVENRRRIAQAVSNRVVNLDLINKSKEIIPAEYKLVKTNQGVERVLVPATEYILRPPRKKLYQPRKLNKTINTLKLDFPNQFLPEKPPPLVGAPILKPSSPPRRMEVDDPDILIVEPPNCKKQFEIIDLESEMAGDLSGRKPSVTAPLSVPQSCGQTLHDRFTMLIGNFHT